MSKLFEKLRKTKSAKYLVDPNIPTEFFSGDNIPLAINVLLSGKLLDGGMKLGGTTQLSAPAATGKSSIAYSFMAAAQKRGMDVVFVDSEKAYDKKLAEIYGIDNDNIMYTQTAKVHEIKQFIIDIGKSLDEQLEESNKKMDSLTRIKARWNVLVVLDSWGVLVTETAIEKSGDGQEITPMNNAQLANAKNDLSNQLKEEQFTTLIINHVGTGIGGYTPSVVLTGGKKLVYNSDAILGVVGDGTKLKSKDGTQTIGKIMTAMVMKGRQSKEFNRLKYRIMYDSGMDRYFGLLDDAVAAGMLWKNGLGYATKLKPNAKIKEADIYTDEIWTPILQDQEFLNYITEKYTFEDVISTDDTPKGKISRREIDLTDAEEVDEDTED